jgi:hypothetical protein
MAFLGTLSAILAITWLAAAVPTPFETGGLDDVRPLSAAAAQETLENEIKAAFLYNFTKYIEWPASAARGGDPFRLCVLADAQFTRALDQIIAGETVAGRPLTRTEPHSVNDVRLCALLYVGHGYAQRGAPLVAAVRRLPVLTVGDSPRFVEEGGAIAFVLENNRVRFDISPAIAQRAGLVVSSKLLRVARSVVEGGRP